MKWFTADLHFGHAKIIEYCNRPFKNVDVMDRELIKAINELVGPDDELYILGDLTLKTKSYKAYVKQLISRIQCQNLEFVWGNHDEFGPFDYIEMGFRGAHTYYSIPEEGIIMCHDPAWAIIDRQALWLCGHIHDLFKQVGNVINVGVDVWDYKPVSLDQISKLRGSGVLIKE